MEPTIESRIQRLLDQLEDRSLSAHELEMIQQKLHILEGLKG